MNAASCTTYELSGQKTFRFSDERIVSDIMKQINEFFGRKPFYTGFPGPLPVSIERKELWKLFKFEYFFSEKNDGQRMLIVATRLYGKSVCFFMNRASHFILLPFHFSSPVFNGTIMDGEYMEEERKFIIFDCYQYSGRNLTSLSFMERLEAAKSIFKDWTPNMARDLCTLSVKQFYPVSDLEDRAKALFSEHRKIDGLIFMPNNMPLESCRISGLFKWKPALENTLDFAVVWSQEEKRAVLNVFDQKEKKNIPIGSIEIEVNKNTKEFRDKLKNPGSLGWVIVECKYSDSGWIPIKIRSDKKFPNDVYTYEKTLLNIQEDLQLSEFFRAPEQPRPEPQVVHRPPVVKPRHATGQDPDEYGIYPNKNYHRLKLEDLGIVDPFVEQPVLSDWADTLDSIETQIHPYRPESPEYA